MGHIMWSVFPPLLIADPQDMHRIAHHQGTLCFKRHTDGRKLVGVYSTSDAFSFMFPDQTKRLSRKVCKRFVYRAPVL